MRDYADLPKRGRVLLPLGHRPHNLPIDWWVVRIQDDPVSQATIVDIGGPWLPECVPGVQPMQFESILLMVLYASERMYRARNLSGRDERHRISSLQ